MNTMEELIARFTALGDAMSALPPEDIRSMSRLRLQLVTPVWGIGRFARLEYWRLLWLSLFGART